MIFTVRCGELVPGLKLKMVRTHCKLFTIPLKWTVLSVCTVISTECFALYILYIIIYNYI